MESRLRALLCAGLLFTAAGPARADEWFDAYTRGLEALKQKKGARAAEAFERAIKLRPEPGTDLITYGTNRLDQYYPYLRLAEAHLMAGNPDAAKDALKRSEARGKEPAAERMRIASAVDAALESARARLAAAATPAPTTLAAAPPPPPTTVVAAPTPLLSVPTTTLAAATPPAHIAAKGTLEVRSDPPGARALLGGRVLGTTPLKVELSPGLYEITLRKDGMADQSFTVPVEVGKTRSETRTLAATGPGPGTSPPPSPSVASAGIASLVVLSDPAGAAVYLDDEPIGATDPGSGRLVKSSVPPGLHRIRLSLSGHEDLSQDVQVAATGLTTMRGTLVVAPRVPPGVIAAVGAGLAALVGVGALMWARRRPAPAIEPTRVPATAKPATAPTPARRAATAATPSGRRTTVSPPTLPGGVETVGTLETRAILAPGTKVSEVGERFGEYLLTEPLGKGGMAAVFKAERGGEICALKRPLAAFLEDAEFRERFLREAEIGRTLHHPNIIRIFERGDVDGLPYFTMELVQGETLQAHVRREGKLSPKAATRVIAQVAEALDYAHLKGVIHRDLKPSNIMILEDGTVKVMDYGIARARRFDGLTVTGAFLGTPDYVAPETAEGKGTDARSDLYSLGIVFYEILTGKKPFVAETPFATLQKHCTEAPTPPSVLSPGIPRELEVIVLRLLCKKPDDRYPGAEELLIELREYLNRAA